MYTFSESLSFNEDVVSYVAGVGLLSGQELLVDETTLIQYLSSNEVNADGPHELIVSHRNEALLAMEQALAEADQIELELQNICPVADCPYEGTIKEYLGPDFVCPSVYDFPDPQRFDVDDAMKKLHSIDQKYDNIMFTHLSLMSAEAADTSFPGITSQNLNNAFAVLSSTCEGEQYVVDRPKLAEHLELMEVVRNLPIEEIMRNPETVARRLVSRYIQIHH